VLAVAFGLLTGVFFGGLAVGVQRGLRVGGDAAVGSLVVVGGAFVIATLAAIPSIVSDPIDPGDLWAFALAGLLVPGLSQILLNFAVRDAGASRAAIMMGTSPLISVAIALVALDEPFRPLLIVGTAFIVAGGAGIVGERARPAHFRWLGVVLALICSVLFAARDNIARWAARGNELPPLVAAAVSLGAATLVVLVYLAVAHRDRVAARLPAAIPAFAPAAIVFGGCYVFLFEAYDRGSVSVIAPLIATQSLFAVVFSMLLFGRAHELIGPRLMAAAGAVVAGSAIIGVVR
jgi:drug/metabolite transporter (DMT)-like permease